MDIWLRIVEETNAVPIVGMSIQNDTALFLLSVLIVMAGIQRSARHAQNSPRECNVLQLNIQSSNTSSHLLKYVAAKRQVDVILLQEVWHPKNTLNLKNYQKPLIKERKKEIKETGGGVAIICHKQARCVEKKEYEVKGLEAIWAEVTVNASKMIVGSVYIPPTPGREERLKKLELIVTRILRENKKLIIGMDANARNVVWDKSVIGRNLHSDSLKLGEQLLDFIENTPLFIHNDGSTTYHSGENRSSPDVTLSYGIVEHKRTNWINLDDDLGSPHNGLLLQIGDKRKFVVKQIIDWDQFPWDLYRDESCDVLNTLIKRWRTKNTDSSTAND